MPAAVERGPTERLSFAMGVQSHNNLAALLEDGPRPSDGVDGDGDGGFSPGVSRTTSLEGGHHASPTPSTNTTGNGTTTAGLANGSGAHPPLPPPAPLSSPSSSPLTPGGVVRGKGAPQRRGGGGLQGPREEVLKLAEGGGEAERVAQFVQRLRACIG